MEALRIYHRACLEYEYRADSYFKYYDKKCERIE
jgi:hypothetical protein